MTAQNNPLVSIIVTFFNEQELLPRCLESIKRQTYNNIEVVLINDGSTDRSLEIAETFKGDFDRFKLITIENSGHSQARNFGLKNATGICLTFLDADDEMEPEMVSVCVAEMLAKSADLVVSRFAIYNQNGSQEMVAGWKSRNEKITKTYDLRQEMFNYGISENVWAKLFRTDLAKALVFEKGLWFDDRPYLFEYLFVAETVSFVSKPLLKIHKREASITRRTLEAKRITDAHRVFELELKIAAKYADDKPLKDKIAQHYLSVLMDNYLIQIIEEKEIADLKYVREIFLKQLKHYAQIIKTEHTALRFKDVVVLKLLQLPNFLGWTYTNKLIGVLKKKRIRGLKKLK